MARTKDTEAEPARPVRAARLDAAGVFQGVDELPEADLTPLHLPEVAECDLPPGRYRWDAAHSRFEPLPRRRPDDALRDPDAVRAIALGFLALAAAGTPLPQETLDWVRKYANTLDANGEGN